MVRVNKVCCPYCSTVMEWSEEDILTFDGEELCTIDIYSCNKCLKDFRVRTELEVIPKNYKIINELNESE